MRIYLNLTKKNAYLLEHPSIGHFKDLHHTISHDHATFDLHIDIQKNLHITPTQTHTPTHQYSFFLHIFHKT